MKLLRNLDLYKSIVAVSVVLLPLGGWWIKTIDDKITLSKKAIADAVRPGGHLEQIGSLQRKIEVVVQNKRSTSDAINDPRLYFQGQILAAQGGGLKASDFNPELSPSPDVVTLPSKQKVADHVVDVAWTNKNQAFPMQFVFAALFNCESGASAQKDQVQQSVWRLQELELINATDDNKQIGSGGKPPPPELLDRWSIRRMKFARREPSK